MTIYAEKSSVYDDIVSRIDGRIGVSASEAKLIEFVVKDSATHIETGCLWGGTAILAALAGAKYVTTIDPMKGGWWETGDPAVGKKPTPKIVTENLKRFAVNNKVQVIMQRSWPFPFPDANPDSFFIDGDHSFEGCFTDWLIASSITKRYVLFHDYDDRHPGVLRVVEIARHTPGWVIDRQYGSLVAFMRGGEWHPF